MKHYKVIFALTLMTVFLGCSSPEPDLFNFELVVKNSSAQNFTLTLSHPSEIRYQKQFIPKDSNTICTYTSTNFFGVSPECGSILTIEFDNGKGYRCDRSLSFADDTLCLDNRELLVQLGYEQESENNFVFNITEDYFLNAKDL